MKPEDLIKQFKKETGILIRGEHLNFQKEVWDYIDWLEKKLIEVSEWKLGEPPEDKIVVIKYAYKKQFFKSIARRQSDWAFTASGQEVNIKDILSWISVPE